MNNIIKNAVEDFINSAEIKEIENFSHDKLRRAYDVRMKKSNAKSLINAILVEQLKQSIPQGFRKDDPSFVSEEKIHNYGEENVGKHKEKRRRDAIIDECLEDLFEQRIVPEIGKYHSAPKIERKSENVAGFEYVIEFDAFDSEIDLDRISLNSYDYKIEDGDVQKEMTELMSVKTNFTESEDSNRVVGEKDLVVVEFVGKTQIAGKNKFVEFAKNKAGGDFIQLGEGKMLPDFEAGIIGLKIGETNKNVNVLFPKDYHNKGVAGLNAIFEITVKKIYDKKEFSSVEEFAEKNKFENVEKLKEFITLSLKQKTDSQIKEIKKREFFDELKKIDIDLPALIIEQEFNSAKINYLNRRVQEGLDESTNEEEKEKRVKDDLEKLMEDIKNQVKLSIAFMDCEKKNHINLEQQDLMSALPNYAKANRMSPEQLVEYFKKNKNALDYFRRNVLEEKILSFIINKLSSNTIQSSIEEIQAKYDNFLKSGE
jgi:trigger factor